MQVVVDVTQTYMEAGLKAQDMIKEIMTEVMDDYPTVKAKLLSLTFILGDYNLIDGNTIYLRSCEVLNSCFYSVYNQICEVAK